MTTQPPQELPELPVVAYARRWFVNGETPAKEYNFNGRLAWPVRFKLLPVTGVKCLPDDEPLVKLSDVRACIAASQAGRAEPIARLLRWEAPKNIPVPHGGVCARTFAEFPKGAGENGYWKEGVPLYSTPPLEVRESAKCGYCGGSGSVNSWTTATSSDICFKCNGAGTATAKGE